MTTFQKTKYQTREVDIATYVISIRTSAICSPGSRLNRSGHNLAISFPPRVYTILCRRRVYTAMAKYLQIISPTFCCHRRRDLL